MGYVLSGYGLTVGVLVAYAAWVLRRERALARRVEPGRGPTGEELQ